MTNNHSLFSSYFSTQRYPYMQWRSGVGELEQIYREFRQNMDFADLQG